MTPKSLFPPVVRRRAFLLAVHPKVTWEVDAERGGKRGKYLQAQTERKVRAASAEHLERKKEGGEIVDHPFPLRSVLVFRAY